jgi:hypothetical protein
MPSIASIIRHTPRWAFGCLAIIGALGIQALKTRTIPLWRRSTRAESSLTVRLANEEHR